ncbi:MAG: hypothetical protein MUO72_09450 [Bacteroidales bacterium]|nr:hypothetical protein [Bacteroidales bacterium]
MEWYLKVPKIIHFAWGSTLLPYLRLLSIKSFMKYNPDWHIILWTTSNRGPLVTWERGGALDYELSCTNYYNELMNLPIQKEVFDIKQYGFSNTISEVHKSDFLRLVLLGTYGGIWSDMDILFFKPINNLAVNIPENKDKETFVSFSYYGHSNAFMMATKDNILFKSLASVARNYFNPVAHQCMGWDLFNRYYSDFKLMGSLAINIGMDAVMAHDINHIEEIYNGSEPKFTENSIGCHWYAGHQLSGKFLIETNGGLINLPNNILGNLIKDYEGITY